MQTGLEGVAAKARTDTKLVFTSLAHHVTKDLIMESLKHTPLGSAVGIDEIDVRTARETFDQWIEEMLTRIHRQSYRAPAVRRVWIPKPGKEEKRPIGVPCVADRALQRSVATVLNAIYEEDFLDCSFGGRPGRGQHNALATIDKIIGCKDINWVFEADLKNFFGSLDHGWLLRFVEHRVGDPRILSLIRKWLKAGVMEGGVYEESEVGTPQGGSISVLLSNLYLHYVLDLWFEKAIKPRLEGECYLIRYIDDFIVCFQYKEDAERFIEVLEKRLAKFSLTLEPNKTRLIEFGRNAERNARERGGKPDTLYFLGFTHYCTTSRKGRFMVGRKTEKSRLKRSMNHLQSRIREAMHSKVDVQIARINRTLKGHYNYYGMGGNFQSLAKVYNLAVLYLKKTLSRRSQKGNVTWELFYKIIEKHPISRPYIKIPYKEFRNYVVL
jgi:group II intron reverse transcriptase/maturase